MQRFVVSCKSWNTEGYKKYFFDCPNLAYDCFLEKLCEYDEVSMCVDRVGRILSIRGKNKMIKEKIKEFFKNRKEEIKSDGLLYCMWLWLFLSLTVILTSPFWLVYFIVSSINDWTKTWFGGVVNE